MLSQDLLKKYLTYAKLNVFPRLHDADLNKLTHVYAELRRESSVRLSLDNFELGLVHFSGSSRDISCMFSMDKESQ